MAEYQSLRRYYLNKRSAAEARRDDDLATLWKGKQLGEAGTDLPLDFPSRADLATYGYTTKEDLVGADAEELKRFARLSQRDADKVIAAYAAL